MSALKAPYKIVADDLFIFLIYLFRENRLLFGHDLIFKVTAVEKLKTCGDGTFENSVTNLLSLFRDIKTGILCELSASRQFT